VPRQCPHGLHLSQITQSPLVDSSLSKRPDAQRSITVDSLTGRVSVPLLPTGWRVFLVGGWCVLHHVHVESVTVESMGSVSH
jgi:hypothetical protein